MLIRPSEGTDRGTLQAVLYVNRYRMAVPHLQYDEIIGTEVVMKSDRLVEREENAVGLDEW
jgi:hypothetical protein